MSIELIAQNVNNGTIYDLSQSIKSISWQTALSGTPGKLELNYIDNKDVYLPYGSPISFKVDGEGVFFGYVFKRSKSPDYKLPITAYDSLRYLKNKDTYSKSTLENMTASERFAKICKDKELKYRVVDASDYKLPGALFDNKTLFDIIQDGIDNTLTYKQKWYMIRDSFGTIEFKDIANMKTNLVIGDSSLLLDYDFTGSIDNDTYNQVKLVKESKETGKREIYLVKDSATIKSWGLLQHYEKINDSLNDSQAKEMAENILKLKNRPTKTVKVTCLGDMRVHAGVGIILSIKELEEEDMPINAYYLVKDCTHKWTGTEHTMELELQVSI